MADYNTAFGPAASGRGIKKCNKKGADQFVGEPQIYEIYPIELRALKIFNYS